jgi:exopolysaccharide biosynthesis polyprenyl glycosylphosphotransferase
MIRRHYFWFRALLMFADAIIAGGLLVVLSFWRFGADWAVWWREIVPQPEAFVVAYSLTWVAILTSVGLYRPRARWSLRSEVRDVLRAIVIMALLTLSVLFLFKLPDVSRLLLLVLFPAQAACSVALRAALRAVMEHRRRQGRNLRYVLVLGGGERGWAFAEKMESHRELGLRVIGFLEPGVAPGEDEDISDAARWPILGTLDDLESILHARVVDEVAVCLPLSMWDRLDAIASVCEEEGKIVRIPIDVMDRAISAGRVEDLDGTPVFSLVSGPDRALSLAAKRLLDVAGSLLVMIVLFPLFAVIAVAIRIDDGGPILFRQPRVGLHGRTFRVTKFRTMVPGADARRAELAARNTVHGHAFKVDDDPRITRVGKFLRRTSLDELPQVQNVLIGDMSLVGPRPPLPDEVAGYDIWHRRRLSMKPGITGLWQVRGRRDPEFDHWVEADLEYIDRWSLWLDVQILFRTIPASIQGR